jgi:hypothetical protein
MLKTLFATQPRWTEDRIVAAIETVMSQILENTWRETEYLLDNLRDK